MIEEKKFFFLGEDNSTTQGHILNMIDVSPYIELNNDSCKLLKLQFFLCCSRSGEQMLCCEATPNVHNLYNATVTDIEMLDVLTSATMDFEFWHIREQINIVLRKILESWGQSNLKIPWRIYNEKDPYDPTIFYVDETLYKYVLNSFQLYMSLVGYVMHKDDAFKKRYKSNINAAFLNNDKNKNEWFLSWESIENNEKIAFQIFRLFFGRSEISIREDLEALKKSIIDWVNSIKIQ